MKHKFLWVAPVLLLLSGCSTFGPAKDRADGAPDFYVDFAKIPNAVPKVEPLSKYGNSPSYVVRGERYYVLKSAAGYDQKGIASWYGTKFYKQRTSSGEPYNMLAMTAASKVLPLPTYVQVTNLQNGKQVIVKVNDRGPFHKDRIMDLSYAAAGKLGVLPTGTALVEVKAIDPRHPETVLSGAQPTKSNPKIYLQLGAFGIQQNAQLLESKVKTLTSLPVVINAGEKNNLPIYRVQIGPIPTVDNTDALHDKLRDAGLGEPITVVQ